MDKRPTILLDCLLILGLAFVFMYLTEPPTVQPVRLQPIPDIDLQPPSEEISYTPAPVVLDRTLFPYEYAWPEVQPVPREDLEVKNLSGKEAFWPFGQRRLFIYELDEDGIPKSGLITPDETFTPRRPEKVKKPLRLIPCE